MITVVLELTRVIPPTSTLFFQVVLATLVPLPFHINFRSFFSIAIRGCQDLAETAAKQMNQEQAPVN